MKLKIEFELASGNPERRSFLILAAKRFALNAIILSAAVVGGGLAFTFLATHRIPRTPHSVEMINRMTGRHETISADKAQSAFTSRQYSLPDGVPVNVTDVEGYLNLGTVSSKDAWNAISSERYHFTTEDEYDDYANMGYDNNLIINFGKGASVAFLIAVARFFLARKSKKVDDPKTTAKPAG